MNETPISMTVKTSARRGSSATNIHKRHLGHEPHITTDSHFADRHHQLPFEHELDVVDTV